MPHRTFGLTAFLLTTLLSATGAARAFLATYEVTFTASWSSGTHPDAWPAGGAHFSPLIGGTHSAATRLWQDGGPASSGIEAMAERGSTGPLRSEVETRITDRTAFSVIAGGGIGSSPGKVSTTFQADSAFPLVSLVSMIAPSPDWFVGVDSLSLVDCHGNWKPWVPVTLTGYDAGTDDGRSFTSPDIESTPHAPIRPLGGGFAAAPPLGTFEFRLVSVTAAADGMAVSGQRTEFTAGVLGAAAVGQTVPEPAAGGVVLVSGLVALVRCRRRREYGM